MAIEVGKIIAATNTLEIRLQEFAELETVAMQKQADANAAKATSDQARAATLAALSSLQAIAAEVLERNTPAPGAHTQVETIIAGDGA